MNEHSNSLAEKESKAVANELSQEGKGNGRLRFTDNRPETHEARKLQNMANRGKTGSVAQLKPGNVVQLAVTDDERNRITEAVAKFVSNVKGTCDKMAPGVRNVLEELFPGKSGGKTVAFIVDDEDGPVAANHTAASFIAADGIEYVVDTTHKQFGGGDPDILIIPGEQWGDHIMNLCGGRNKIEENRIRTGNSLALYGSDLEYDEMQKNKKVPSSEKGDRERANERSRKCYITTACVNHVGLSDDCEELTVLRHFRDTYLRNKPGGDALVSLYYTHAPAIVDAIRRRKDEDEILKKLYGVICTCVAAIKHGDAELAFKTYCKMVIKLKREYAPGEYVPLTQFAFPEAE